MPQVENTWERRLFTPRFLQTKDGFDLIREAVTKVKVASVFCIEKGKKILKAPKFQSFVCLHDIVGRKFPTWPHGMAYSQNAVALKILCRVTFRACV